ncbi:hypothetical protein [Corallococcus carmarthensis]|uniref:Lipoprotein n=1 Tax=Corallococcus carmarthensis TaxID=2316728 RepID=A0A3A8JTD7_9BACT|nr:hypothetical protein [Corallococcus carmarthensis]RKG98178.1 hypothetical protein D7X32_30380 [Corallococcus carmarthensis]
MSWRRHLAPLLVAVAFAGCSSGAHSSGSQRDLYAQATCVDSETCCIQRNPGNPSACGLTAAEAAAIMAAGVGAAGTHGAEMEDHKDDARLPEWKQRCIRNWNACADGRFTGPCTDCLRRCEGQQDWPLDMCRPAKPKR